MRGFAGIDKFAQGLGKAAMVLGLTLIILNQFLFVGSSTEASNSTINAIITALGDIPDWVTIIVVVFMAAIVFVLMSGYGKSR